MAYGLFYQIQFSSVSGKEYRIEIEKADYTGEVREAIAGETPFSVSMDDNDFLYTPSRFSSATIHVEGGDELSDLYADNYQQLRVLLKDVSSGAVLWCGFIKPEAYTQDYTCEIVSLELECESAMSSLEHVDYTRRDLGFISFINLIGICIQDSKGLYDKVYIPHVYGSNEMEYNAWENILRDLSVSEQNFFDEDDKPMNLKEVLEEVCKFMGWTLYEKGNCLYFVDNDNVNGEYFVFDPSLSSWDRYKTSEVNVQSIGYDGDNHTIDILPGYNKATVKCSNYPADDLPADDYDELEEFYAEDVADGNNVSRRIFLLPEKVEYYTYERNAENELIERSPKYFATSSGIGQMIGAIPMRYCNYTAKDNKPSIKRYTYTDVVQVRVQNIGRPDDGSVPSYAGKLFKISGKSAFYSSAIALAISGGVKYLPGEGLFPFGNGGKDFAPQVLRVFLKVGKQRYDGSKWVEDDPLKSEVNKTFNLPYEGENVNYNDFVKIADTKTLQLPFNDLNGYIIQMGANPSLRGKLELTVFAPPVFYGGEKSNRYGFLIKDFKVSLAAMDGVSSKGSQSDKIYENEIGVGFVNEADEIELKLTSNEDHNLFYSTVILRSGNSRAVFYFNGVGTIRPEELLVRRVVNQYSKRKIKLTQELAEYEINPVDLITDNSKYGMKFRMTGCNQDYQQETQTLKMIEVV